MPFYREDYDHFEDMAAPPPEDDGLPPEGYRRLADGESLPAGTLIWYRNDGADEAYVLKTEGDE